MSNDGVIQTTLRELAELRDVCEGKASVATPMRRMVDAATQCGGQSTDGELCEQPKNDSERLEQKFGSTGQLFVSRAHKMLRTSVGYYLSDVLPARSNEDAERIAAQLAEFGGVSYKRGLLLISVHNEHVHIVHDCSFSNKTCRCDFLKKTENMFGIRRRGRSLRRRPLSNQLTIADLQNIFVYFTESPRRTTYCRIGGRVEDIQAHVKTLEIGGIENDTERGPLEAFMEVDDAELRRGEQESDERIERDRRGRQAIHEKRQSKYEKKSAKMLLIFKNNPMSPIQGVLNHPIWLKDPELQFLTPEDKQVKAVMNNWCKQLCTWTIYDYQTLYNDKDCTPIFSAGYGNVFTYYYSLEDSVNVLEELLLFQFNNDTEQVYLFLKDLFNILERKLPKLNCLVIHSPPSSGKNFFFDCICDYYINVGHLCRANKYNQFAFQDAEGRRLIMWNEPNYSSEFLDQLKELLGGDSTNVTVKYKAEAPIYRTPVIVLTNKAVSFMNHPAFKDRTSIYRWTQAAYLKDKQKKPFPLATFLLFKKYNLVEYMFFIIILE